MRILAFVAAAALAACANDTFVGPDSGGDDGGSHPDGAVGPDAAAGDACAGEDLACNGSICDDFESGLGAFAPNGQNSGGTVSITGDEYVSCSHALEVDLDATGAGVGRALASVDKVGITASTASVTLDVWVWLPSGVGAFNALIVRAGTTDSVTIERTAANGWRLHASAASSDTPIDPAVDQWNHMVLGVEFTNQSGNVSLTYLGSNGNSTSIGFNDRTLGSGGSIGDLGVDLGLSGSATVDKLTAYYDNVSISVK